MAPIPMTLSDLQGYARSSLKNCQV